MEGDIREVARQLNNIIRSKNVKGLIVGYPLDDKMMPTRHCNYIEEFINQLNWNGQLRSPVTLINEYGSSVEAKAQIASRVNLVNFVQLTQMR
jgi:RNase H-fold protein (predicted Holliday junction resolvase)